MTDTETETSMNKIYKIPFSEVKILSQDEALEEAAGNAKKWNIVSIFSTNPTHPNTFQANFKNWPRDLCFRSFDDIVTKKDEKSVLCNKWHILTILDFAKKKYDQPIIFHCWQGISRSAACCFLSLLDSLKESAGNPVEEALKLLIQIKSPDLIRPNKYIVGLGFHVLAKDAGQEMGWLHNFYNSEIYKKIYV